jgi:hemerythrin-like domain-containing protein
MAYTVLDAAASRFPEYRTPAHNVLERPCLQDELRAALSGLAQWPPERWVEHPDYANGLARHWQEIHRAIVHNLGLVERSLRTLAEDRIAEADRVRLAGEIAPIAKHSVDHLHGHHRLEDQSMFPQLLRAAPSLARPLSLLEADHIVLNAVLGPFERALAKLPDATAPASAWDEVAKAGERVARVARRHIEDEEEIVIPAVLGVTR